MTWVNYCTWLYHRSPNTFYPCSITIIIIITGLPLGIGLWQWHQQKRTRCQQCWTSGQNKNSRKHPSRLEPAVKRCTNAREFKSNFKFNPVILTYWASVTLHYCKRKWKMNSWYRKWHLYFDGNSTNCQQAVKKHLALCYTYSNSVFKTAIRPICLHYRTT